MNAAATPLTLRFTEWRCGHHCTRPDDIAVQSPEQALQICLAIAFAISQPGEARAVVLDDERYFEVYISDDTISVGHGHSTTVIKAPERRDWGWRPIVICGSAEEIDAIHAEELANILEYIPERLDSLKYVEDAAVVTTTLSREEVERLAAPIDWHESGGRKKLFDTPPIFRSAADVLADARAELDAEAAYQAELAAEAAGVRP